MTLVTSVSSSASSRNPNTSTQKSTLPNLETIGENAIIPPPFLTPDGQVWGRQSRKYDPIMALCHNIICRDYLEPFLKEEFPDNLTRHGNKYQVEARIRDIFRHVSRDLTIQMNREPNELPKSKDEIKDDIDTIARHMTYLVAYLAANQKTADEASRIISNLTRGLHRAIIGGAPGIRNKGNDGMVMQAFWILLGHAATCASICIGPLLQAGHAAHLTAGLANGVVQDIAHLGKTQHLITAMDLVKVGHDAAVGTATGTLITSLTNGIIPPNVVGAALEHKGEYKRALLWASHENKALGDQEFSTPNPRLKAPKLKGFRHPQ